MLINAAFVSIFDKNQTKAQYNLKCFKKALMSNFVYIPIKMFDKSKIHLKCYVCKFIEIICFNSG